MANCIDDPYILNPHRKRSFPAKVLCRLAARRCAPQALLAHSRSEWAEFLARKGAGVAEPTVF